jgi:hypothetical protein
VNAQAPDVLEHNNIRVTLPKSGNFFYNSNATGGFEVPINSGNHALHSAQFYFMGKDVNGQLKASIGGPTSLGRDVFDGPYSSLNNYDSSYQSNWEDRSWQICQEEIELFKTWWEACEGPQSNPQDCANAETPSNATLTRIFNWPAHGDVSNGEAYWMAPFWDENSDGVYNPLDGDYPLIKGCCATWRIENDAAGIHTMSGADALHIEMRYMTYQYRNFGLLNDVTFVEVELINRGTTAYYDFVYGAQVDLATATNVNAYIGSDSTRSLFYGYYDSDLHPTLGQDPPVLGVVALDAPLTSIVDMQSFSTTNLWETMHGLRNGQHMVDLQGDTTTFIYDDNPNLLGGWSQEQVGGNAEERVILATQHDSIFAPGDRITQTFAFVYMRNGTRLQSIDALYAAADELHLFYDTISSAQCENGVLDLVTNEGFDARVAPNPASESVDIVFDAPHSALCTVRSASGQMMLEKSIFNQWQWDVRNVAEGVYFIELQSELGRLVKRVVVVH